MVLMPCAEAQAGCKLCPKPHCPCLGWVLFTQDISVLCVVWPTTAEHQEALCLNASFK